MPKNKCDSCNKKEATIDCGEMVMCKDCFDGNGVSPSEADLENYEKGGTC